MLEFFDIGLVEIVVGAQPEDFPGCGVAWFNQGNPFLNKTPLQRSTFGDDLTAPEILVLEVIEVQFDAGTVRIYQQGCA